jgi:hypothetical protein
VEKGDKGEARKWEKAVQNGGFLLVFRSISHHFPRFPGISHLFPFDFLNKEAMKCGKQERRKRAGPEAGIPTEARRESGVADNNWHAFM